MVTQAPKIRQTPQCWRENSHATQSDRTTVANMEQIITDLTLQLGQANAKLTEAQSSITTLTSKIPQTGTRPNRPTTIPTEPINMTLLEKDGYCWSHGFKIKKGHNSTTCILQKQGHMTEATRNNTMGVKMWNKGWDKRRNVCDKLVHNNLNIISTTNNIANDYNVDNLAVADSGTSGFF